MGRYDARTLAAIHEALDDEYKARATYEAVIERFGPVRPFTSIIGAEERHARALERLLDRAGEPIPADPWRDSVAAPVTLADALALGVQAEIDNRDLYDRLERMTAEPEVLRVFANLRRASQDNHLPAFQRRLDRMSGGEGLAASTTAASPTPSRRTTAPALAAGGHHAGRGAWTGGRGQGGHNHGHGQGHGHGGRWR